MSALPSPSALWAALAGRPDISPMIDAVHVGDVGVCRANLDSLVCEVVLHLPAVPACSPGPDVLVSSWR